MTGGSYNLVDPVLNWGASFRYNPLFLPFVEGSNDKEILYLPLKYLLFCKLFFFLPLFVGLFLKFRFSLPFLIGSFVSLVFTLFNADFFFWSAFHVFPLTALLIGYKEQTGKLKILRILLGSLLWAWCSGPLAFIGSFALFWMIKERDNGEKLLFISSSLLFALILIVVFPIPSYPEGAILAELSQAIFWPTPLFGPSIKPNPLHFSEYASRLTSLLSTAVTNVLLSAALLLQFRDRKLVQNELGMIFFTSSFLACEALFGGKLTQHIGAVMFGLPLLPFPWFLAVLGVLTSLGMFINSRSKIYTPFNIGFIILTFFYLGNLCYSWDVDELNARPVGSQFSKNISKNDNKAISKETMLNSIQAIGANSNVNPDQAQLVVDGKAETRWSSSSAMKGGETLEIALKEATNCSVISISPGDDRNDFPRGVKVLISKDGIQYTEAASVDKWIGPIRATKDGFLYYGSQNDVELKLDDAKRVTGIKITQTGKDNFFFWTVSEVRCGT